MSYTGTGQFKRTSAGTSSYTTSGLGLTRENGTSYTRDDRGKLLSMRTGSGSYYYLLDGLGSVSALTDSAGDVVATYSYEPFGKLTNSTGTIANPYRWLGGLGVYHDTNTGLYKMGTRYYDPNLGRFTQVDPVSGGAANAYDYAMQDPVNEIDPDGTCAGRLRVLKPACRKAAKAAGTAARWAGRRAQQGGKWVVGRRGFPRASLRYDSKLHNFPLFGRCEHIQLDVWLHRFKGTGRIHLRIPIRC